MSGRRPAREPLATGWTAIAAQAQRTNNGRAGQLRTAVDRARCGALDAEGWAAAERTAHQLAGSAGTFGYPAVSDLARSLERLLRGAAASGADGTLLAQVDDLLDQVVDQLARDPGVG